jgi:hypothetical protein
MRNILIALGLTLGLVACTAAQQTLATDIVPAVVSAAAVVDPAITPALTATANLACAGQAVANAAGDSTVSKLLGVACTW